MNVKTIAAVAALFVGCAAANAVYIDGTLEYNANATAFTYDSTTANFAGPPASGKVNAATGDLAGLLGLDTVSQDLVYDPFADTPGAQMDVIGSSFSFDLMSLTTAAFFGEFLNLSGSGMAYFAGFDATPVKWTLAATENAGTFNYSATITTIAPPVTVPDGGTTLTLLGFGIAIILTASRTRLNSKPAKLLS